MSLNNRPRFSMAATRNMTNLTDRQIRYYEEVGLIKPFRTRGNQRIFSAQEIEQLKEIKKLLDDGMSIEMVKEHFLDVQRAEELRPALTYVPLEPKKSLPGQARGLTSLYPVSDRAQLVEMILERRKAQARNKNHKE